MMKTLPKNLSEKKIEIINDFVILKKSYDECQSKYRISEYFFDETPMLNDVEIKVEATLS